ncbi:MAG: DUF6732 family protein [Paracoccaceae bacterium]
MRILLASTAATLAATTAEAHLGHLSEAAGHDHWLGAAALGAAIAIGLWQAAKARKDAAAKDEPDTADAADPEAEPKEA